MREKLKSQIKLIKNAKTRAMKQNGKENNKSDEKENERQRQTNMMNKQIKK